MTTPARLSPSRVEEIRQRRQKTTDGQWWPSWDEGGKPRVIRIPAANQPEVLARLTYVRDNDFVAHAPADIDDLLRELDRVSALLRAPEVGELARDLRVMACVVGQAALDTGESTGPADLMSKAADLLDALRAEGGETT